EVDPRRAERLLGSAQRIGGIGRRQRIGHETTPERAQKLLRPAQRVGGIGGKSVVALGGRPVVFAAGGGEIIGRVRWSGTGRVAARRVLSLRYRLAGNRRPDGIRRRRPSVWLS